MEGYFFVLCGSSVSFLLGILVVNYLVRSFLEFFGGFVFLWEMLAFRSLRSCVDGGI